MIRPLFSAIIAASLPLAAAERPNVLVILTDDLGYSGPGGYGSEIETPTLDRLASKGLRFSGHLSGSAHYWKKAAKTKRRKR